MVPEHFCKEKKTPKPDSNKGLGMFNPGGHQSEVNEKKLNKRRALMEYGS